MGRLPSNGMAALWSPTLLWVASHWCSVSEPHKLTGGPNLDFSGVVIWFVIGAPEWRDSNLKTFDTVCKIITGQPPNHRICPPLPAHTHTQHLLCPLPGVQLITTVPSFYTNAWDQETRSSRSHCKQHMAVHAQPTFLNFQPEKKARMSRLYVKAYEQLPSLSTIHNPALGIVTLTLFCGIHYYYSMTLEKNSIYSFLKIKHFTFQSFLYRGTTLYPFQKSRWHNPFCMPCMPPSSEKGSEDDNKGFIPSPFKVLL